MSTRFLVSLFLLGVGVGSPWLVQDWIEGRVAGERSGGLSDRLASLPDRIKNRIAEDKPALPPVEEPVEVSSERAPYPLAAQTQRLVQGFLSPSAGEKVPFFSTGKVPTTPRTLIITENAAGRLHGDLADLALELGDPAYLRVFKEEAELEVWLKSRHEPRYVLFKVYRLTHCAGKPGPKLREGDGQSPEGFYFATSGSMRPETRHHLGIDLGFPNAYDAERGYTGSDLMIHGGAGAAGAFALSPQDVEEVYAVAGAAMENGQKLLRINVFPFRMTDKRMDRAWKENPACLDFWVNLKEGYDFFENVGLPPVVEVVSGRYAFRLEN